MTRHQVSGNSERTPGGADPAAHPRLSRPPPGNRTFPDRHGFWGRFVKSPQNTASRRSSVAFHGLGNGRRLC